MTMIKCFCLELKGKSNAGNVTNFLGALLGKMGLQ